MHGDSSSSDPNVNPCKFYKIPSTFHYLVRDNSYALMKIMGGDQRYEKQIINFFINYYCEIIVYSWRYTLMKFFFQKPSPLLVKLAFVALY